MGEGYPMRLGALISTVVLLLPAAALSQDDGTSTSFKNGTELYQACTVSDSVHTSFCIGYVMGVSDSLQSLHLTCSPKQATGRQVTDLVVSYLRDHPDARQYVAAQEVTLALVKAFPCKK
jgi:hypothetical protein